MHKGQKLNLECDVLCCSLNYGVGLLRLKEILQSKAAAQSSSVKELQARARGLCQVCLGEWKVLDERLSSSRP